jgi:Fe-S cluster assembly protein SufD
MTEKGSNKNVNTLARERVDTLSARCDEPKWLQTERSAAWELYLQTPMPTVRDEEWRRTDIDSLTLSDLTTVELGSEKGDQTDMPEWFSSGLKHFGNAGGVVAVHGNRVWTKEISAELREKGVIFCDLPTAFSQYPELVQKKFASDSPTYCSSSLKSKFALMNQALFNGGFFLYIPPNVEVNVPFIALVSVDEAGSTASVPRIFVSCGANSKASLVQVFLHQRSNKPSETSLSLSNALIEMSVGENAKLDYVEVQNFHANVFAVSETHTAVARNGRFASLTIALGGSQVKSDIITTLQDRGASSEVLGVVLGDDREKYNFNTVQEHNAPDTTSDINFRVALKGESSSVYQGIIRVAKVAQGTNAYQSNKNLLLGDKARADSIPKLEILTDDVKCSHGATVGPIDKEQLFYLMSRGLDRKESEELVVGGFFRQVVEACGIKGVHEWIGDLVGEKIHR